MFSEDSMERFPQIPFLLLTTSSLPSPPRLTLHSFSTNIGFTLFFLVDPSISPKPRPPVCFLFETSHSPFCSAKNLCQELLSLSREVFPLKNKPMEGSVILPIKVSQRADVDKNA